MVDSKIDAMSIEERKALGLQERKDRIHKLAEAIVYETITEIILGLHPASCTGILEDNEMYEAEMERTFRGMVTEVLMSFVEKKSMNAADIADVSMEISSILYTNTDCNVTERDRESALMRGSSWSHQLDVTWKPKPYCVFDVGMDDEKDLLQFTGSKDDPKFNSGDNDDNIVHAATETKTAE